MRSHLEFRSVLLNNPPGGEAVAMLLAAGLPNFGFTVEAVAPEDWGWRIRLANARFPLWIGCGPYLEYPDGWLCFIEPARDHIFRWFRYIPTTEIVERLASAVERSLTESGKANDLRWWTEDEVAAG